MVSFIKVESVRVILPGVSLPLGKNGDYFVELFKEKYDINIEYLTQTKTLPVEGSRGSRVDQIINVQKYSLDKFDEVKTKLGALYATEIVKNNEHHLYNERVYLRYLQSSENELLKSGEISKEDVYEVTK